MLPLKVVGLPGRMDLQYRLVIVPASPGSYRRTDRVRVTPGQHEYLESFGDDGVANTALLALPTYE